MKHKLINSKMPVTCIVMGCGSRADRDKVSFFRMPAVRNSVHYPQVYELSNKRRQMWLEAIKRENLTESILKNERICSKHFITGRPSALNDEHNPDWVPSQHMGYTSKVPLKRKSDVDGNNRADKRNKDHDAEKENEMIKLGGVVENGQKTQRAKYILSATVPSSNTIRELIPINYDGRLISQHSVSVPVNELGIQLLKAAGDGSIDQVKQLLTKGAPFTADWLGTSPLHLAAQNNHIEITEILLRAGISKDARTKVDRTPLHMAAYEGHVNVVEILLKYGAEINCRDLLDMTPLHWAVQNSHIDVVAHLLRNDAQIEVINKFELTPIMISQQTGRSDIEQLLVEALNDSAIAAQNLLLQFNARVNNEKSQQMFTEDMEMETAVNGDGNNYTVLADPILIEEDCQDINGDSSQNVKVIEQEDESQESIEKVNEQLVQNITVDPTLLTTSLKILEEHGITMLQNDENDDGNILNSVMESGHSVVLTDIGKEVLNTVKQNEQRKQPQILHMDKKIVSVTPEQFLAMTNNSNKAMKNLKVIPAKGTFKRVVMKKNKIIPISSSSVVDVTSSLPNINKENPSKNDLELVMNQLIEAKKTIEEYKIKLKKKEQEADKYKMQLKLLMSSNR